MSIYNKRNLNQLYEFDNLPNIENPRKKRKYEMKKPILIERQEQTFEMLSSHLQILLLSFVDRSTMESVICAYPQIETFVRSSMILARAICARSETMALNEMNKFLNDMTQVQNTNLGATILRLGCMKPEKLFVKQTETLKMIDVIKDEISHFESKPVPNLIQHYFKQIPTTNKNARVTKINDQTVFLTNLNTWFHYDKWKHILLEYKGLIMAGGTVTHAAVARVPVKKKPMQAVHLFLAHVNDEPFDLIVDRIMHSFEAISFYRVERNITLGRDENKAYNYYTFYVHLDYAKESELDWVPDEKRAQMIEICESDQFVKFHLIYSKQITHPHTFVENFDLDISQCLFDGKELLVTHAWMQAFQTNTCLSFAQSQWDALWGQRVRKYSERYGLDILMLNDAEPEYVLEDRWWYYTHKWPTLCCNFSSYRVPWILDFDDGKLVRQKREHYKNFLENYWIQLFLEIHKKISESQTQNAPTVNQTLKCLLQSWPLERPNVALNNDEFDILGRIIAKYQ